MEFLPRYGIQLQHNSDSRDARKHDSSPQGGAFAREWFKFPFGRTFENRLPWGTKPNAKALCERFERKSSYFGAWLSNELGAIDFRGGGAEHVFWELGTGKWNYCDWR